MVQFAAVWSPYLSPHDQYLSSWVDTGPRCKQAAMTTGVCVVTWLNASRETACASFPPDDRVHRLADWNQLLLCWGRTELLGEESGVSPGQPEGDDWFDVTDDAL